MQLPDPETCLAIARAVVAAGKWRWYAGMLTTRYGRVAFRQCFAGLCPDEPAQLVVANPEAVCRLYVPPWTPVPTDALPDFTDPLTAAGAELVAREVCGFDLYCSPISDWLDHGWPVAGWQVHSAGLRRPIVTHARGRTKLEATIAAILSAPISKESA